MAPPLKTHCKHGHEYTLENTVIQPRGRGCKTCKRINHTNTYIKKGRPFTPLETRLWAKVDKTLGLGPNGDCWEWRGHLNNKGYGKIFVSRATKSTPRSEMLVHRLSYKIANERDAAAMFVMHSCDNPACVNPAHLSLGTGQDNVDDMMAKNRHWSTARTHCSNGHELTVENTYSDTHHKRLCAVCRNKSIAAGIAKRKLAAAL